MLCLVGATIENNYLGVANMCAAFYFSVLMTSFHLYELEISKEKWLHFLLCAAECCLAITAIVFGILGPAQHGTNHFHRHSVLIT